MRWSRGQMTEPGPSSNNGHDAHLLREFATAFDDIEGTSEFGPDPQLRRLAYLACADLLDSHNDSEISLDTWHHVRALVEYCIGHPMDEDRG